MQRELLEQLREITDEERRILNGEAKVDKDLYTSGSDFTIDSRKMLEEGKLIAVRTHTRFVHFPVHRHNYVRNVMPAYLSIMAIAVPHVLGGTYVVESVFSYPGIGALSYESARYHDYNLLMLLCMMSGILVIFCNIVSQTINEQIDPRMKDEVITEKSEVVEG